MGINMQQTVWNVQENICVMESVNGTVTETNVNSNKVLFNKNNKTISQFVWFAERCWIMLFICVSKNLLIFQSFIFQKNTKVSYMKLISIVWKKNLAILRYHWSHFYDVLYRPSGYVKNAGHVPGTGQITPDSLN